MNCKSIKFGLLAVTSLCAGGTIFANNLPQGGVVQEGAASLKYAGGGGGIFSPSISNRIRRLSIGTAFLWAKITP